MPKQDRVTTAKQDHTISIINGPNINMLGHREPTIYGGFTLENLRQTCQSVMTRFGWDMHFMQSNHEGEMIDTIHRATIENHSGILINAGAYSHTSVAILDALRTFEGPMVEVHISNIYSRETFRHRSWISQQVNTVICGASIFGYDLGLQALHYLLVKPDK